MTVSESRRELTDRFRSSGVESPEVNAEWLLASLLNCSRTELPLRLDETIPDPQLEHLNSQAARRAKREPLQHILGTACFCGLKFQVTPAVLVPRPETEELIELAFEAAKTMPCPVIYDFGTGSGCIAVTLAKRLAKAKVIASDISDEALRLAKANAEQHEVIKRVEFRQADGSASPGVREHRGGGTSSAPCWRRCGLGTPWSAWWWAPTRAAARSYTPSRARWRRRGRAPSGGRWARGASTRR